MLGLLLWDEVWFDGRVILPNSIYAVIAFTRKCLTCTSNVSDGLFALERVGGNWGRWRGGGGIGRGKGKRGGTFTDRRDVFMEEGIEAFWQNVTSGTRQGGVKGRTRCRVKGYHLLYHSLWTRRQSSFAKPGNTYADALILDRGELGVDGVFALTILEQLTEGEERCTLEEHFSNDAAGTEDVHWLCDWVIGVGLVEGPGLLFGLVETLWSDIAGAPAAGIIEKGKVGGIVEGETGWFVGGKVGEVYPI